MVTVTSSVIGVISSRPSSTMTNCTDVKFCVLLFTKLSGLRFM